MYKKIVTIVNHSGIHARPASMIVSEANKFASDIILEKNDGEKANPKSIMGVIVLALSYGSQVIIKANGPDEYEAVESLAKLISEKFHEE